MFMRSESPALSSANTPPPPKIKMYGPVVCWVKKTSIEFHIYSKRTDIKPFKLNMELTITLTALNGHRKG